MRTLISILWISFFPLAAAAQDDDLSYRLKKVIKDKKAEIGIAVILDAQDTVTVNNDDRYPLMSVFKFHQALAVADYLDRNGLTPDTEIFIPEEELVPDTYSPLREEFPEGEISLSVSRLLEYSLQLSDNNACDILFEHTGGPAATDRYVRSLGLHDFAIAATEQQMHDDPQTCYENWSTPLEAAALLELLVTEQILTPTLREMIRQNLISCKTGADRLPKPLSGTGAVIGHKTGTSDRDERGIFAGTNDLGFVILPDGTRYTDSQCGLFGVSRQLQRFHVPFSYIETSPVESDTFARGFEKFVSVACMVKNFRGMRIAQVGMRPKPFCSVIFNEGELMEKFGLQIIPVNLAVIIDKYHQILQERDAELEAGAKMLLSRYEMDDLTPPLLKKVYAFVLLYQWVFEAYNVQAVSAECWTAMQLGVGAMPCTAYSVLADMGYIISCESDLHGAITMALLSCASLGKKKPFFGEFTVRHPENKNAELLWHCGPFAYSLKKEGCPCKNVNMRQWFQVKDGQYTVSRFDQDNGSYSLLAGTCRTTDGPYTFGTYLWAEFDDLSAWEKKLIEGPYIHHMAEIEGDYTKELKEFCKFVPGLTLDTVATQK